jgi:hypothetical protein
MRDSMVPLPRRVYANISLYQRRTEHSRQCSLLLPCFERQSTDITHPQDQYRTPHDQPRQPILRIRLVVAAFQWPLTMTIYSIVSSIYQLPASAGLEFTFNYESIAQAQERDAGLGQLTACQPQRYVRQMLAPKNRMVYCYIPEPRAPWKIYLPNELLENAVRYYHLVLSHVGTTRLYDTISMHFYNRAFKGTVENIVSKCDPCQRSKLVGRGHRQTAPREAALLLWHEVAVDPIGPWELKVGNATQSFSALTIIDLVTNLTKIVRIENKMAAHVTLQFENTWFGTMSSANSHGLRPRWRICRISVSTNARSPPYSQTPNHG